MLRYPPAVEDPQELRAYLFRVAGNLIVDGWRQKQRQAAALEPVVIAAPGPDAALRLDMERMFRELRPRDRQLMWLAYVEGASHREIAAALRLRERSIRVLLSRARKHLARLLGESGRGGDQS
jgi:RNA polymerase sigma-70 factor (ECF subfamily)